MPTFKGKFKPSSAAERAFYRQLKKVAQVAGHIVERHAVGAKLIDEKAMTEELKKYSDKLGPWAEIQAAKMLNQVQNSNRRAYQNKSKAMGAAFKMGAGERDVLNTARALLNEQVGLIKSIPIEAGLRAQKIAFEAVISGVRAEANADVIKELENEMGFSTDVAISRATLIARTETARANAAINQSRAQAVGSRQYRWHNSGDAAVRPSHKTYKGKRLQGMIFSWDEPPTLDDGMTGHPGTFPNCRCVIGRTLVSPVGRPKAIFRRHYTGDIHHITTKSGLVLDVTSNHPVLSMQGWRSVDSLNLSDQIFVNEDSFSNPEINNGEPTIEQMFDSCSLFFRIKRVSGSRMDFHGDGMNHDVDVIRIDKKLSSWFQPKVTKLFENLFFAEPHGEMSRQNLFISLFGRHAFPFKDFALGLVSSSHAGFAQPSGYGHAGHIQRFGNRILRFPAEVSIGNLSYGEDFAIRRTIDKFIASGVNSPLAHLNAEIIGAHVQEGRNLSNLFSGSMKCDSIINKSVSKFSGFVYNLHSESNYYFANGIAMHNCFAEPIFENE